MDKDIPGLAPEPSPALRRDIMNALGLLPAGANVVMQLARLPIGHAVATSTVTSGALTAHPFKRTRTTLGYVVVSLLGTDEERVALRREVARQHRTVRSAPDAPVAYNAADPELQLWVAACMYRGALDAIRLVDPEAPPALLDELYARCARFATTLQVAPSSWPADRSAFKDYWAEATKLVAMDDLTRRYLWGIASLSFLPRPLGAVLGPLHRVITAGFLPEPFRTELGLAWNPSRERLFHATLRVAAAGNRVLPRVVREFPLNLVLLDARRRLGRGRAFT